MKAILVNYNYDPTWLKDYPELDVLIYDRSDDGVKRNLEQYGKVIYTENVGNVDFDKLNYLVDNYHDLPDVFLWGKSNLFKYISKEEFDQVKDNKTFTPLLTKNHKTYMDGNGWVCFYDEQGMYRERNDSWYLNSHPALFARSFNEWASMFQIKAENYIPFAPGGNYILTKEKVHQYSKYLYEKMRDTLSYTKLPGEAHLAERSYFLLWR